MKKALSLILVLALTVSMLCTAAFAEGSKSDMFQPTGSGSKSDVFGASGSGSKSELFSSFNVDYTEAESEQDPITAEEMADAIANIPADDTNADVQIDVEKLVLVAQKDFSAAEYPVFVTFYGEGTEDVTICQFVKYEGTDTWVLVYAGLAGEWTVEFEAAGTYAIAVVAD